jgi:hypothetical protein
MLGLGRCALAPLILHALDPHPLTACAGEEEDANGETEPQDAQADEKRRDADHRFQSEPPSLVR